MSKTDWFDGWLYDLKPGEDFAVPIRKVARVREAEGEDLDPYESPRRTIVLEPADAEYPAGPIPFQREQGSWSRLAVCLHSICQIIGGERQAQQLNVYDEKGKHKSVRFEFKYVGGSRGFQPGGRL